MRQCGECTLCCTVLRVPEFSKPEGTQCRHCAGGCSIYKDRPESCRTFNCAWLEGDMGEEMRPDKSHAVIEKLSDDIMLVLIEPGYDHVLPQLNKHLSFYTEQNISVVASNGLGLLPEGVNSVDVRNAVVDRGREMGVI